MKQTAVEWLVEKLKSQGLLIGEPDNLVAVNQAKAMEKEQIKNSYHSGTIDGFNFRTTSISPNPDQYYNETYSK